MVSISVEETELNLAAYLSRVEAGETVVITRADKPVAEIKPVSEAVRESRPSGLCAGQFPVPDDFDGGAAVAAVASAFCIAIGRSNGISTEQRSPAAV